MSNKTINDYSAAVTIDPAADFLLIEQSSVYNKINRNILLGLSSAPLGLTDAQSPTNKIFDNTNTLTIKDGNLIIQNSSSVTKQAVFSAASITAGQTRTFTFPDASGTLVTTAATQTLTAKTLTSPTITGGTIDNSTITVDSIAGHTSATIVTVANLQISNGVLNTAGAVTATSIAAGGVQPNALVAGTGAGWAWQSWTPTFANLTVGNGVLACDYTQIGKTVIANVTFTLGTTSSMGTTPTFTLPVTSVSLKVGHWLGAMRIISGSAGFSGYMQWISTTTASLLAINVNGTNYANDTSANFTAAIPGVWTNNDSFAGTIIYQAA